MIIDTEARRLLQQGDFSTLFKELGWDNFHQKSSVVVGDDTFALRPVAQKRGVQVFSVTGADGGLPPLPVRVQMERRVSQIAAEHLLIFHDTGFTEQRWQWVSREPNRPLRVRTVALSSGQSGESLLQKLGRIAFGISDEEAVSLVGVTIKLRDAFDRDRVTKTFFDRFDKVERPAFHALLFGVSSEADQSWYTSVMINRVMFLYFIQSKGFLDGDPDYLKNRLAQSRQKYGPDKFYTAFLRPLFFDGLAKRQTERTPERRAELGELPYLSGSLFVRHEVENRSANIAIPDAAFEKLFGFLSQYEWHLDDRPVSDGRHINPDVLGYIFEKYINQKQMGAYYTKEDITEYISKNTLLPFLLERVREKCPIAFAGEYGVWSLLSDDPDRYIYAAVRHGADLPLPAAIEAGVGSVALRGDWNAPAPATHGLPTEIWRETVARRARYADTKNKLQSGGVQSVGDLITLNLDIRQFVEDVIARADGANLIQAVWETLAGTNGSMQPVPPLSVLDPTCGSGAFLFAALEILQPLYAACVEKMRGFVEDADRAGRVREHQGFREIIGEINNKEKHPSEPYYLLKKIITHNLFGVDIMDEATEVCKLRLFLKLAAQVDPDRTKPNMGIEPLPDIDFNIRAGNTLVGYATKTQMQQAVNGGDQRKLLMEGEGEKWAAFKARLEAYDGLFEDFLRSQEGGDFDAAFASAQKAGLRAKLQPLRDEADALLGHEYGKIGDAAQTAWKQTAKPFHWFVEFYRTLKVGGFDCIIGNPPYVEYSKVKRL